MPSGPATMRSDRSSTKETDGCSRPVKHALPAAAELPAVSRTTGIARSTIGSGLADLRSGTVRCSERVRRRGGGQKPVIETQPGILEALNELVEPAIRGDPEAALRWVSLSQRHLSAALAKRGFIAGQKLVGRLLKRLNFSLQANRKTREGANHPDRNTRSCTFSRASLKPHSNVGPIEKRRRGDASIGENAPKSRTTVGERG